MHLRTLIITLTVCAGTAICWHQLGVRGQDKPIEEVVKIPKIEPLEPKEAAKAIVLRPGFEAKLVASEPNLRSPVAIAFDEDGKMYVAEFVEYNQYVVPDFKQKGSVRLLEDTNGDGVFDKSTLFADNLDSPVAVGCWDGGVFVGAVPDLWYLKDTTGDGKADLREKIITGFEKDKAGEAMLNSFCWGPDNVFHISTSYAGGELKRTDRDDAKPLPVRRQNIRFDPLTRRIEPTSGGGQHGMSLDDFGDTFVCDNSNPIRHLMYDGRYLVDNPHVEAPTAIKDINAVGRYPNLGRISPPEPWREARTFLRSQKLVPGSDEGGQAFGFFTGATGVTVYRGDAYPEEFHGDVFVGEVANNLVYRAKLKQNGLSWIAERAEKGREFLAAKDVWFRPVQFANGPDGCLYVVDMYRELIEGAAFLPPQLLEHVDVAGGMDRGRIYRIQPEGFQQPKPVKLGQATTAELVKMLEHPNGWHRDTAARLLTERQDQAAVEPLRQIANGSENPVGRMHARYTLASLRAVNEDDLLEWIDDPHPRCREHAIRLAEKKPLTKIAEKVLTKVDDDDVRVRYQLAFSLGKIYGVKTGPALAKIARRDGADSWFRLAVLCSSKPVAGSLFSELISDTDYRTSANGKALLNSLAGQIGSAHRPKDLTAAIQSVDQLPAAEQAFAAELVQSMLRRLPAAGRPLFAKLATGRTQEILDAQLKSAKKVAASESAKVPSRVAALKTLELGKFEDIESLLADCLEAYQPGPVQQAALETLVRFESDKVPGLILHAWPGMSPQVRATATESLLARPSTTYALLDGVEAGRVKPIDLDPARVQILIKSNNVKIRERAKKLFSGVGLSQRTEVIKKYQPALELKGDVAAGKKVFEKNCTACHKLENVGNAVGPDLASIKNRGLESVMENILDPNREVLPQYFTYTLTTDDGVTLTGMITAETANTVTIRKADGATETVQRVNIESLRSTGISAMPEGIEQQVDLQGMADLLAYLNSIQ